MFLHLGGQNPGTALSAGTMDMIRQSIESVEIDKPASEVLDELIHAILQLIVFFNLLRGLMVKYSTHLYPNEPVTKHNDIIGRSEIEWEQ